MDEDAVIKINGRLAAFPAAEDWSNSGMTVREYFAAQAMIGVLGKNLNATPKEIAFVSVAVADALLAELAKQPAQ